MSLTTLLLIIWGVVTAVFVVLLIYRSTLSMQEDDQLFLDESESHMQKEQAVVLQRLEKLQLPLRLLGAASGVLILVIAGVLLWRGLNSM
jgi:Tfp pilus assembly protein PilN